MCIGRCITSGQHDNEQCPLEHMHKEQAVQDYFHMLLFRITNICVICRFTGSEITDNTDSMSQYRHLVRQTVCGKAVGGVNHSLPVSLAVGRVMEYMEDMEAIEQMIDGHDWDDRTKAIAIRSLTPEHVTLLASVLHNCSPDTFRLVLENLLPLPSGGPAPMTAVT